MKKSEIRFLIVEDDKSLALALEKAILSFGYKATVAHSADQALQRSTHSLHHIALLDCMLPGQNGVELAAELRKTLGPSLEIVLMSGIYKDKVFIQDSLRKVHSRHFLQKPFDLKKLNLIANELFSSRLQEETEPLHNFLQTQNTEDKTLLNSLEQSENIHGYDLPLVLSALLSSQLSGQLHITNSSRSTANNSVSMLEIHQGQITRVQMQDNDSYFGVLIVENRFASVLEVKEALLESSPLPIGQRLVAKSILSPHHIDHIQRQQMEIRISKLIQDSSVHLSFIPSDTTPSSAFLSAEQLPDMLVDWVCAKIKINWLKSFYLTFQQHTIEPGPHFQDRKNLEGNILAPFINTILSKPFGQHPLSEVFTSFAQHEEEAYKALHFLLLHQVVKLKPPSSSQEDLNKKAQHISVFEKNLEGKNHFEILGIHDRSSQKDISRAYHELAKSFHPDKIPTQAPQSLQDGMNRVFAKITKAHETLIDDKKRQEYKSSLLQGDSEVVLQQEEHFEQALQHLDRNHISKAFEVLKTLRAEKFNRDDFMIYYVWAALKTGPKKNQTKKEFINEIARHFSAIPPEERHHSRYYYIKGLYLELTGQIEKSIDFFRHAMELDKQFICPRRELLRLKADLDTKEETSSGLFSFFKKKKVS